MKIANKLSIEGQPERTKEQKIRHRDGNKTNAGIPAYLGDKNSNEVTVRATKRIFKLVGFTCSGPRVRRTNGT